MAQVCGCIVHEEVSDAGVKAYITESEAETVLAYLREVAPLTTLLRRVPSAQLCTVHRSLGHTPAMYAALLEDNLVLVQAIRDVILPVAADFSEFNEDNISWQLTVDRVLEISLMDIPAYVKLVLQSNADVTIGLGKVLFL